MLYNGYFCDKCGIAVEYKQPVNKWLPSKTDLIHFAREDGWSIGKRVLCPDCRNIRK